MENAINKLFEVVEKLYLKIYYTSEKELSENIERRKDIDEAVYNLLAVFKLNKADFTSVEGIEWIYYTDIFAFWEDEERMKNNHHAWMILSEYVPNMFKELKLNK